MKIFTRLAAFALLMSSGFLFSSCTTERTPTNERLSQESIGSATVGKKPGVKNRAHDYMMRR